jgi:Zn-dependent M28 family amino/carboxypeptidase
MQGRQTGSKGAEKAQLYLKSEIAKRGVFDDVYDVDFTTRARKDRGGTVPPDAPIYEGTNIHALIDVNDEDLGPLLVITAHYDHLGERDGKIFNGADDNASGSAALFAIAESFTEAAPQHDILFIWFDAEEMGLQGAVNYVEGKSFGSRPVFNLNLDMVSQSKAGEIYASGSYHTPALKPIVREASKGIDLKLSFGHDHPEDGPDDWTLQSDHGVFHRADIPFLYFGVEDHPYYHKDTDTFETIPLEFYQESLKLIVNTAHALDENLESLAKPAKN